MKNYLSLFFVFYFIEALAASSSSYVDNNDSANTAFYSSNFIVLSPESYDFILEFAYNNYSENNIFSALIEAQIPHVDKKIIFESFKNKIDSIQSQKESQDECICNVFIPSFSNSLKGIPRNPNSPVVVSDTWWGTSTAEIDYEDLGPSKNVVVEIEGGHTQGRYDLEVLHNYHRFQMINLCVSSLYGTLKDGCKCNKPVFFSGNYSTTVDLEGTSGSVFSHGRWANGEDWLLVHYSDYVAQSGNNFQLQNLNFVEGLGVKRLYAQSTSWRSNALLPVASIISAALGAGTFDLNSENILSNAIQNLVPNVTTTGSTGSGTNNVNFDGSFFLIENVQKIFYLSSMSKLAVGGYGPSYTASSKLQSEYYISFFIPDHPYGYDDSGQIAYDDVCCNEPFGMYYIGDVTEDQSFFNNSSQIIKSHLNIGLPWSSIYDWQNSVGATLDGGGFVEELVNNYGYVWGEGRCIDCEELNQIGSPLLNISLDPNQQSSSDCIYNINVLNNFSLGSNILIQLDEVPSSGPVSVGTNFAIQQPGLYSITFYDQNNDGCLLTSFIHIPNCPKLDGTFEDPYEIGDEDERPLKLIENFSDFKASPVLFPNPSNGIFKLDLSMLGKGFFSETSGFLLYDMQGSVVHKQILSDEITEIILPLSLPNAIYIYKIVNINGDEKETLIFDGKLIINRQ